MEHVDKEERLLFAVPKKGRIHERVLKLLKGAGLSYKRQNRLDVAHCYTLPISIVFLPAKDIAQYIGEGEVDMGITGEDIIAEAGVSVNLLKQLDFGKCRLAVLGPKGLYKSSAELAGKRIVTSFPHLTEQFFGKMENGKSTHVRYVSGSVEAAVGLGLADAVVDLVETGTTMRAAGLEEIETIMTTQSVLVSNPNTKHQKLVDRVHKRLEGYLLAQKYCMLSYNVETKNFPEAVKITPGHEAPTVTELKGPKGEVSEWLSVSAMVNQTEVSDVMDMLIDVGAESILMFNLENCRFRNHKKRIPSVKE